MCLEWAKERMQDFGVETPFPLGSHKADARIKLTLILTETGFENHSSIKLVLRFLQCVTLVSVVLNLWILLPVLVYLLYSQL
jgi:hypothetical protein